MGRPAAAHAPGPPPLFASGPGARARRRKKLEASSAIGVARAGVLLALAAGASYTDIRTRRIPDGLTLTAALLGVALALAGDGLSGGGWALAGLAVGGIFLLPAVALGYVGGGDMKLLAAAGALLGPMGAVRAILLGAILGGIWAVGWLLARGDRKASLPYGPPLAVGAVISFFL